MQKKINILADEFKGLNREVELFTARFENFKFDNEAMNELQVALISFEDRSEGIVSSHIVENRVQIEAILSPKSERLIDVLGEGRLAMDNINNKLTLVGDSLDEKELSIDYLHERSNELTNSFIEVIQSSSGVFDESILTITQDVEGILTASLEALDAALLTINDLIDDNVSLVEESIHEPIFALNEEIVSKSSEISDFIKNAINAETIDYVQVEVLDNIQQKFDELFDWFKEATLEIVASIISGGKGNDDTRSEMEIPLEIVELAMEPIESALNSIKAVAGTVGISI